MRERWVGEGGERRAGGREGGEARKWKLFSASEVGRASPECPAHLGDEGTGRICALRDLARDPGHAAVNALEDTPSQLK